MGSTNISPQPRQQPGCACEQCRKRKLRCDRQRPQCGTCAEAGIYCEVNSNRQARGPKKGDLKALRSRIVALERRLSLDLTGDSLIVSDNLDAMRTGPGQLSIDSTVDQNLTQLPSPYETTSGMWKSEVHVQMPLTPEQAPLALPPFKFPPSPTSPPSRPLIDDMMGADLDSLYFDRVHPNVPIFNQTRYIMRSRQRAVTSGPSHQLCLQYAMWTLAMALSSQFDTYRDGLYKETKQMLETLEDGEEDMKAVSIEQVQAWVLIAFYEFARGNFRRGWITAGRAFRLVQLANLHSIDSPENLLQDGDPVLTEERRRTFWVAFCLDRFISIKKGHWPLTLTEEAICTRLPSPEQPFQVGHPMQVCFLSEAIASDDHSFLSSLAECAVLASICGRGLSHCQVSKVEGAYGSPPMDFWLRHEWLESMLNRRLDSLAATYPVISATVTADPMLLFTFMMAQATVITLNNMAVEALGPDAMDGQFEPSPMMAESTKRALQAAHQIASLVKSHEHIGYFKAHIFLPSAIYLSAARLRYAQHENFQSTATGGVEIANAATSTTTDISTVFHVTGAGAGAAAGGEGRAATTTTRHGYGDSHGPALRSCLDALRKMKSFNNLARDHLSVLETGEFMVD